MDLYLKCHDPQHLYRLALTMIRGDPVSQQAVKLVFEAMFTLTDIRALLRETAPFHRLDEQEKKEAEILLSRLTHQVDLLKGELLR